jgi:hypothetical protein
MALMLTAVFVVLADYILNEKSKYCLLPKSFIKTRQASELLQNKIITDKEINDASELLEKAKIQKMKMNQLNYLDVYNSNKF